VIDGTGPTGEDFFVEFFLAFLDDLSDNGCMETYSVKQMAEVAGIPESTIRYYRDRHKDFIPYTGKGRRRRYTEESLEILLRICGYADDNLNAIEIDERLNAEYDRIIEVKPDETEPHAQRRSSAAQQEKGLLPSLVKGEILPAVQGMITQALTGTLELIADQKGRLDRLEADNRELKAKVFAMARRRTAKQKKGIKTTEAGIVPRQDIEDMKQLTRKAMRELDKIRANLDRISLWVENRGAGSYQG